jgi:hypothetical protein
MDKRGTNKLIEAKMIAESGHKVILTRQSEGKTAIGAFKDGKVEAKILEVSIEQLIHTLAGKHGHHRLLETTTAYETGEFGVAKYDEHGEFLNEVIE